MSLLFVSRLCILFVFIIIYLFIKLIFKKKLSFLHKSVLGTYSTLHLPQELEFARSDAQFR